jgi:hypothetical protein
VRPDDEPPLTVDDLVAERVEAARRRIADNRARRARQQQARNAGLAQRHAAKLRHLADCGPEARRLPPPSTLTPEGTTVHVRITHCPACRAERITKRVAGVVIGGAPHDVLQCPDKTCELCWCVRADRPRVATAA